MAIPGYWTKVWCTNTKIYVCTYEWTGMHAYMFVDYETID